VLVAFPYWIVGVGLFVVLFAGGEAGFRLGLRRHDGIADAARSEFGTVQGAILGMLGLLLAFTFSMAVQRYDLRRQLVLEEANDIGTTYLRAAMLPEPAATTARDLLRRYVDVRLRVQAGGDERATVAAMVADSEPLHAALWEQAVAVARSRPDALPVALFVQSLNAVIDDHAKRLTAFEARVPDFVLEMLALFAVVAVVGVGYGCGLAGGRSPFAMLGFALLLTALALVILDLDQPRQGLITVNQAPMRALRASIGAPS
jgi:hypothetical protein